MRFLPVVLAFPLFAQISVPTYQYDNSRAGANLSEPVLTKTAVTANRFGKLSSYPVDGYVYGQPLYIPRVSVPQQGVHNVVYVVTEHDSVYAFDADSSLPLWHTSFLGSGVTTVPAGDTGCGQIVPELGITSTPVIDTASGTLYVVAMTKESGAYFHRLHALDIAGGAERSGSPVIIQASVPGTGEGGATVVFRAKDYKQRPGLLLLNGVVYTAWSSHCDIGKYHGWLMGYDAATLRQVSVYNNTPNGNEGSFWGGGAAPAADSSGNIYLVAGNGTFDYANSGQDLGESFIKLSSDGGLSVTGYFTPFNFDDLNNRDVDTGSAGVALLPDEAGSPSHPHLMAGAGKEGRIYLLDRDNPGKFQAGSDTQIVQSIPGAIGSLFGNPAYYNRTVYFCGSGDNLKAFPISAAAMATKPASQSAEKFGFPGCLPTVSANGTSNGIVWILDPAAVLRAYDASNLGIELYNSGQNPARDSLTSYVKFSAPMVANGKVYVGTQNSLAVFGPLASGAVSVSSAASGDPAAIAPGAIVSIYGTALAPSFDTAQSYPLPATLAGVSATVNGVAAPLYYASPSQINLQIPFETPAGPATVTLSSGSSAPITVKAVAPGLFLLGQGRAAAQNSDYSINSPSQPAAAGSTVMVYLTGLGAVSPQPLTGTAASASPLSFVTARVTATVGGTAAAVSFAGLAPGYAGLYQVNLVIPQLASGDYPLLISAGGATSNAATISVR